MRFISKSLTVAALFCAITVHADSEAPAGQATPSTGGATVTVELTGPEMRERAATFQTQVDEHHRAVLQLQEKVRQAKDVIKLNCVNDRLVQLKAQMNIVDSTMQQLRDVLSKDEKSAQPTYRQLEGAVAAVAHLHEEANGCVGEPELYKGQSVEVTHPPFPDDPVNDNPFDPSVSGTDIEPPAYASLFF